MDEESVRDKQLENLSGTDSEEVTSDFLSGSDNETFNTILFEKLPDIFEFTVMNETVQPPEEACGVSINYEECPNTQTIERLFRP